MLPEILVADDKPDIRSLFALIFRRRGWGCHEAVIGSEAFHFVRTNLAIGIIFIDIHIPNQTGPECMARIKGGKRIATWNSSSSPATPGCRRRSAPCAWGLRFPEPIRTEQVWQSLKKCRQRFQDHEEQRILKQSILAEIGSKNSRIRKLNLEVDAARIELLETLAMAAEHRDNETGAHIRRVGAFPGAGRGARLAIGAGRVDRPRRPAL